nr:histone deacetylase family protein [Beijerinckiaceae bacterium]
MSTLLLSHTACLDHATPHGHPERADRIRAIDKALSADGFAALLREEAPRGTEAAIVLCHPERHLAALVKAAPDEGIAHVDADTVMSPGTLEAAFRAVGGATAAVDAVLGGRA